MLVPLPSFRSHPHSLFSLHSAPSTVVIKEKLHPFVRLSPRIMDAAEWRGRKENRAGNGKNLPSFSPSSSTVGLNFQAPIAKVSKLLRRRRRRGTTVSRIIAAAAVAARRGGRKKIVSVESSFSSSLAPGWDESQYAPSSSSDTFSGDFLRSFCPAVVRRHAEYGLQIPQFGIDMLIKKN